jgi:hypothetical protein
MKYINHIRLLNVPLLPPPLYEPNACASNFIKYTLIDLKTQTDPNTLVVGDFDTLLTPIASHQDKISIKKL